ncbi:hypothetical protein R3W88_025110 [Solanum pinnatisectum]|uniref:Reverse transcriptase zinc-binding domain-containing protein n=1 Tax=Solanum pinnatisectum TaxID=50273 RepID=A0AAV9M3X2_9SOLN|nr:hypothetical protein R3W88_025110 [Solanum pinnatisectum]
MQGRVQLLQTILFGVQSYWAQLFLIPSKVVKLIEAHCKRYVWTGTNHINKKALVAWEKICTPKSAGGLNITNLHLWNKATIAMTFWDLTHKQDKIWIRWIHSFYIKNHDIQVKPIPQHACWMNRKILKAKTVWNNCQLMNQQSITRELYLRLIRDGMRVPWKCLMFNTTARPKAVFIMWLYWMHMTFDIGGNWQQHLTWALKNAKGKTIRAQSFKMVYAEAIYAIWIERIQRVFV